MEVGRPGRCAYKSICMAYLGVLLGPEQARALLSSSNFPSAVNPFQVLDPAEREEKKNWEPPRVHGSLPCLGFRLRNWLLGRVPDPSQSQDRCRSRWRVS